MHHAVFNWLTRRVALLTCGLALAAFAACALPAVAAPPADKEEEAFGEEAEGDADKPAADAAEKKPAAGNGAAAKPAAGAAAEAAPDAEPVEEEPAVQAVLESKPKTPLELVQAVDILEKLDRANLAEPYLKLLVAAKPTAAVQSQIVDRFGSATLLRLADSGRLSPEARAFFSAVIAGAQAYHRDSARLAKLVADLSNPDENRRGEAIIDLKLAHEAAVPPLVAVLADAHRTHEHAAVRGMLIRLGDEAIAPLLPLLDATDPRLVEETSRLLGQLGAQDAVPHLLSPALAKDRSPAVRAAAREALVALAGEVPSVPDARRLLEKLVRTELDRYSLPPDESQLQSTDWQWDDRQHRLTPIELTPQASALASAVRLSGHLDELTASDASRRLHLKLLLETIASRRSAADWLVEHPAPKQPEPAGADLIESVLTEAVAEGLSGAAAVAAEMLGERGDASLLTRTESRPAPLVAALANPNRWVRFAAMEAILKLHPAAPFAGSNHVVDALSYFASSAGARQAVVAHPRGQGGAVLAGLLAELGFDSELATNGRAAFRLAVASSDVELIVLHMSLDRPPVDELLAQLRRDRRTARIPVLVLGISDSLERAHVLAAAAGRARAAPPPQDLRSMKSQLELLLGAEALGHGDYGVRLAQARRALTWLVKLSGDGNQHLYALDRVEPSVLRALEVPGLTVKAAVVLANLGSPRGQTALVDVASRFNRPIAARRAAMAAFSLSVEQHGILLTSTQMLQAYDRYNHSEDQPDETRTVLASILDALESRTAVSSPAPKAPAGAKKASAKPAPRDAASPSELPEPARPKSGPLRPSGAAP